MFSSQMERIRSIRKFLGANQALDSVPSSDSTISSVDMSNPGGDDWPRKSRAASDLELSTKEEDEF
jgi:hypothetical protein